MSGGVFAVSRGIFEHEFFEDEPFTEREAWIWLIREAAWKPRKVRSPTGPITIQRGQCSCSVGFLADRWKWSKSRVGRFLHRLQKQDMIGTASGTGQMVITICKYDEYQRVSLPGGTVSETEAGQQRDSSGTNKNTGEYIEGREDISLRERSAPTDVRKTLWEAGVKTVQVMSGLPESKAKGLVGKWLKQAGDDASKVLAKIRQAEADRVDIVPWVTKALQPAPRDWRQEPEYRGVQ